MGKKLLFYTSLFGTILSFSMTAIAAAPYTLSETGPYSTAPDTTLYPEPEAAPAPETDPETQPEVTSGSEAESTTEDVMVMESSPETIMVLPTAEEPIIRVTVPSNGKVIINPYHISLPVEGRDITQEIIHIPQLIVNHSNVPVQINASAIGNTSGDAQLVSDAPSTEGKEIFLYAEFQESDETADCIWFDAYEEDDNQLIILETETTKDNVLTLEAGDETPSYGVFRLNGQASISDNGMWTNEDSVSVRLVFTFQAVSNI